MTESKKTRESAMRALILSTAGLVIFILAGAGSLFGSSPASFLSHRDYPAAVGPQTITKADLNGDGLVDLIIPNNDINFTQVSILFGNRDGSFQPPKFVNTGGRDSYQAVVGDFNGDGKADLAVTTIDGLSVLLGDGHGNFGAPRLFSFGSTAFFLQGIVAADFNGDGKLDLAVTDNDSNKVLILLGAGDGTFQLASTVRVGMSPGGIAVGDFNHDGHVDLAVADSGISDGQNQGPHANTVAILLGLGNGRFLTPAYIPVAAGPIGIAVGDFDTDGEQDIVVTNSGTDQVSLLLGNGKGTFANPKTFSVSSNGKSPVEGYIPTGIAVDDFNGDGHEDLAIHNIGTSTVAVLFGDGKGNFGKPLNLPAGRVEGGRADPVGIGIATGDFNHDGKIDLIATNYLANTISVILGQGNGTFVEEPRFPVGPNPFQLVVADFNNDGIPDVATVNLGYNFKGDTISVLLGVKGGGFQPQKVTSVAQNMAALAAADFNGDGKTDLVVVSAVLNEVFILLGKGDGTFEPPMPISVGSEPGFVAVGDFNGDGDMDIAVSNFHGPITLLLGNGDGTFRRGTDVTFRFGSPELFNIATADLNRDGKIDLVVLTRVGIDFVVKTLLGNGDGTFQTDHDVTSAPLIFSFAIGDLNNDGIPDLAVEEDSLFIETLLGDGHGNFASAGKFNDDEVSSFSNVQTIALADFNGDGFLDVVAADGFSDNVTILMGNGDGTLTALPYFFGAEEGATWIGVGDFHGGPDPDIAVATTNSQTLSGQVVLLINSTR